MGVDLPPTDTAGVCEPSIIKKTFQVFGNIYNFYGVLVCSYDITCNVDGSIDVDCIKSIDRFDMRADKNSIIGWSCDADIRLIEFESGSNGFLIFAWGYTYGPSLNTNISLSWGGSSIGFQISGGGDGSTGISYIVPSQLN